jgi:hypothetical protein
MPVIMSECCNYDWNLVYVQTLRNSKLVTITYHNVSEILESFCEVLLMLRITEQSIVLNTNPKYCSCIILFKYCSIIFYSWYYSLFYFLLPVLNW